MGPVIAPAGTVAVTVPELLTVNVAALPLNETAVAPVKFVPVIVTPVPTAPITGAKEVMAGVTVKRVVVTKGPPPGVVTVMGPVVAPAGTVVVIVPEGLHREGSRHSIKRNGRGSGKGRAGNRHNRSNRTEGRRKRAEADPFEESYDVVGCGGPNRGSVDPAGQTQLLARC